MLPRHLRTPALLGLLLALAVGAGLALPAAAQGTPPGQQRITIETPPQGTQVGSPMVVTGNLARLPASASLLYNVLASDGRQIGGGSFAIPGTPGEPALFMASLSFAEPPAGDTITLQLVDQDQATGGVVAVTTLPLVTAPLPQRILIDSPPTGTQVGNPVVVTGRTVRFPAAGVLGYAIYDSGGFQVGGGVFAVEGTPVEGGRFGASLPFSYPLLGGPLRIDLYDQDPVTGAFLASASMQMRTVALIQQIVIETPPFGTQVGSPLVLTGRAAQYPASGLLQYEILDAQGVTLGAGTIPVQGSPGGDARFVASLNFQPPATPGRLRAIVFDTDAAGRQTAAVAELRWGP